MKSHLGSIDADDRVGLFESGFVSRAELLQQVNLHWCALLVLVEIRGGGPQHPDIVFIFGLKNRLFRRKVTNNFLSVSRERGGVSLD